MSLCPVCGHQTYGGMAVCLHHIVSPEDWHVSNRILCDFFHRGIVPSRLTSEERDDALWMQTEPA